MWLGLVIAVALVVLFVFVGRNTPTATAEEFLEALAKGDYAKLADLTYSRGVDHQTLVNEYKFATQEAGKNYSFVWRIKDEKDADANDASVQLSVIRNATRPTSYEENYEIPLIKQDGTWKVDVASINDTLYPALPQ